MKSCEKIEPDALRFEMFAVSLGRKSPPLTWNSRAATTQKNPAYAARLLPTRLKTMVGAAGEDESSTEQYSETAARVGEVGGLVAG